MKSWTRFLITYLRLWNKSNFTLVLILWAFDLLQSNNAGNDDEFCDPLKY